MSFSRRPVALQKWSLTITLGAAALFTYTAWDIYRSRRGAVPLFNPADIVKTVEATRYPCTALRGFDAVVREYYVESAAPTTAGGLRATIAGLFSDPQVLLSEQDVRSVRLVVGDSHSPQSSSGALASGGGNGRMTTAAVASGQWPAGTEKYAALVLEPSAGAGAGLHSNPLHLLADGATHQSLLRCSPLSTMRDMTCEADPSYLGAPYLRVMLSAFLLLPASLPSLRVGVLGVGGGSLANFLQRFFEPVMRQLDLVDVEPMCFRAAVEDLGMKEVMNSHHHADALRLHAMDASEFLRASLPELSPLRWASASGASATRSMVVAAHNAAPVLSGATPIAMDQLHSSDESNVGTATASSPSVTRSMRRRSGDDRVHRPFDLLFVDLFVGSELATNVTAGEFLLLCRAAMSTHGVAAFNLPDRDAAFVDHCKGVFGKGNVFVIPTPASSNSIVLARGGAGDGTAAGSGGHTPERPIMSHRHFYWRAKQLQERFQLPYDLANHYPAWWRLW